jgi:hypothetical protein
MRKSAASSRKGRRKATSATGKPRKSAAKRPATATAVRAQPGRKSVRSTRAGFAVILDGRGPNVHAVNRIEVDHGGDPNSAVPYMVSSGLMRSSANSLVVKFQQVGAEAHVEP